MKALKSFTQPTRNFIIYLDFYPKAGFLRNHPLSLVFRSYGKLVCSQYFLTINYRITFFPILYWKNCVLVGSLKPCSSTNYNFFQENQMFLFSTNAMQKRTDMPNRRWFSYAFLFFLDIRYKNIDYSSGGIGEFVYMKKNNGILFDLNFINQSEIRSLN